MENIFVNLGENSYNIKIGYDILKYTNDNIKGLFKGKKILIITDDNLDRLYCDKLIDNLSNEYIVDKFVFEHGEQSKNLDVCKDAYDKLIEMQFSRSDLIIAFGGGVVGDLAGFVASTYLRGVPFVQIPTSLLAQVDSSVGGKVAVDLPQGKNLVGSFYQPKLVIIDCDLLKTLPEKFLNDGLGEVIKYGFITDNELFEKLSNFENRDELQKNIDDIIYTCCCIKKDVVESDEHDTGIRMILNFGHTLGHAIEKVYGYSKVTHGEGVCIGMNLITKISEEKNLTKTGVANKIENILKKYDLPFEIGLKDKEKILEAIKIDKKNLNGNLNLILIEDIGKSFIYKSDASFFENLF